MNARTARRAAYSVLLAAITGWTVAAASEKGFQPPHVVPTRNSDPLYSKPSERSYPTNVYWGDTHLHTTLSMDAYNFGNVLGPEDAYRFARGETVMATHGQPARLSRPLDFLVVADHADGLGAMQALARGDSVLMKNALLRSWRAVFNDPAGAAKRTMEPLQGGPQMPRELDAERIRAPVWNYITRTAERFNQPGKFTALIGYEWTGQRTGQNLHRVVIFRDGASKTSAFTPLSPLSNNDPRALWQWLANYESKSGGKVLAIAHNGNLSNGIMFPLDELEFGGAINADYVKLRARWEPVYEVTQIKGDGETHPYLSPDDEFAKFERWDFGDFAGVRKTNAMLPGEYAREALKRGLVLEKRFGTNPYHFGMIGSTDSHTSLAAVEENNFFGKHSAGMEPGPKRWSDPVGGRGDVIVPGWMMASSGYAAVWARENTREEIWDALARREVYATTGPRMTVRFFGGWNFSADDVNSADWVDNGYHNGVPMGGELSGAKGPPRFMINATKEADGANLDRVQVVKGWIDATGQTHEKVYDVAWSDAANRKPGPDGKLPAVGNTVQGTRFTNTIGAPVLATWWQDPDFDAGQAAFYYVRVLQIPTPRWTAYDSAVFGTVMKPRVPMVLQERAYSSPIWYRPPAH